jgi:hypothetical protein
VGGGWGLQVVAAHPGHARARALLGRLLWDTRVRPAAAAAGVPIDSLGGESARRAESSPLPGTPTFEATTGVPGQPGAPRYAALAGAGDGAAGVEAIGLLAEAHALDPHVQP